MNNLPLTRRAFSLFATGLLATTIAGCKDQPQATPANPVTPAVAPIVASGAGPTLVFKAAAPGLSAEEISGQIGVPIEKQLQTLKQVPLVETICTEGQVNFLIHTKPGCDMPQLGMDVRNCLAIAEPELPQFVDESSWRIQTLAKPQLIVTLTSPEGKFNALSLGQYYAQELHLKLSSHPSLNFVTVTGTGYHQNNSVLINGQPGIAVLLAPSAEKKPAEVAAALQKLLDELRAKLPAGMSLQLTINAANRQPNETNLVVEMQLPDGASEERKLEAVGMAGKLLQEFRTCKNVVGFTWNPLEIEGLSSCFVLNLAAEEAQATTQRDAIRRLFETMPALQFRLKNFGEPDATSLRAAISGPEVEVAEALAEKLEAQLRQLKTYRADPLRSSFAVTPRLKLKLDRAKLVALGVTHFDVASSLSKDEATVPPPINEKILTILLPVDGLRHSADELGKLPIKNAAGKQVRLSDVATLETGLTKLVVYRVNNQPAVLFDVQTLGETTGQAARKEIAAQFNTAREALKLGEAYKLIWLEE